MNYAHPLAFDIHPTGPFLFSLNLLFFPAMGRIYRENDRAKSLSSNQSKIKQLIVCVLLFFDAGGRPLARGAKHQSNLLRPTC